MGQGCSRAFYHPPAHPPTDVSADLLDIIEFDVITIVSEFPDAHVIIAGDLDRLPETEIVNRTGLSAIAFQPTMGNNRLDRIYVSDQE